MSRAESLNFNQASEQDGNRDGAGRGGAARIRIECKCAGFIGDYSARVCRCEIVAGRAGALPSTGVAVHVAAKCCARGRPIIVEWERDARHSAGLSLVR
ncbi:hypothetical protein EVAR_43656_1 [Eumeta japonica]|uniref:Uncharacterized protein n=1 Tax=Eumeta variegata TaxID=151549 RepID=A0A4C1XW86_EUMVA|nr:hypothetical protein EVAR_43656_1 [Eumeta japonica]